MPRLELETIGDGYTSDFPWTVLERLTAIGNRMGGQDGERRGAEVVRDAFESAGLDAVRTEEFEVDGWWRGTTELTVERPEPRTFTESHQIISLPGTPQGHVEGELVTAGYGLPEDFEAVEMEGKVVLVREGAPDGHDRWVHRNEKYARAREGGAIGFLYRSDRPGGNPTTGHIGFNAADAAATIPGAGVSYETGYRLEKRCARGYTEVELSITCRNERTVSRNVTGVLGPDTAEEVIVGAHYDAHDIAEGAGDDGAGVAIVAEIGRLLEREEEKLETKVRLIGFGSEELGMRGSYHTVASREPGAIKCVVNNDAVGDGRNLVVNDNSFEEISTAFRASAEEMGIPISVDSEIRPHGDQWPFVRDGIPAAMTSSRESGRFEHAHTHLDTLDKIDVRDLRPIAVTEANAVLKLADRGRSIGHKPVAEIEDSMNENYEQGLRIEGRWPF